MPEVILGLVIVALLVERYFSNRAQAAERIRLTNALVARTPGDLVALNRDVPRGTVPREPRPTLDGFEGQAGLGG